MSDQMQRSKDADHDGRKLFLGGLPFECTEEDLRSDFGKFGEIEDLQFPNDGGRHKGFAFITYRDAADCSDASKEHHQRPYRGAKDISARIVVPRSERTGSDTGRPGDWTCPRCSANVFASKSACYKCGEPKPSGGDRGGDRYGDRGGDRYGDRGGDRYGDRGGDRYGDRGDRDDRYGDRGGDRYGDRGGDRYGDRGGDRYGDRGGDRSRSRGKSVSPLPSPSRPPSFAHPLPSASPQRSIARWRLSRAGRDDRDYDRRDDERSRR